MPTEGSTWPSVAPVSSERSVRRMPPWSSAGRTRSWTSSTTTSPRRSRAPPPSCIDRGFLRVAGGPKVDLAQGCGVGGWVKNPRRAERSNKLWPMFAERVVNRCIVTLRRLRIYEQEPVILIYPRTNPCHKFDISSMAT